MKYIIIFISLIATLKESLAWTTGFSSSLKLRSDAINSPHRIVTSLNQYGHGEGACFLPLKQLDQDYNAPRIFQIAGVFPELTKEDFYAVTSEPPPELGQWAYDFSDPDGPQAGTVAIDGSHVIGEIEDGIAMIADHFTLNVPLPETIKDPVDLIVIVDRSRMNYVDRKFMVLSHPTEGLKIAAFASFSEMPKDLSILGHVEYVQIPWLPSMKPTRSGFMEEDELF